jgi:hypothetical protein
MERKIQLGRWVKRTTYDVYGIENGQEDVFIPIDEPFSAAQIFVVMSALASLEEPINPVITSEIIVNHVNDLLAISIKNGKK